MHDPTVCFLLCLSSTFSALTLLLSYLEYDNNRGAENSEKLHGNVKMSVILLCISVVLLACHELFSQ